MDDIASKPYRLRQDVRTLTMGLGACFTAGLYFFLAQRGLDESVLRRVVFASACGWWILTFTLPTWINRRARRRAERQSMTAEEGASLADIASVELPAETPAAFTPAPAALRESESSLLDPATRLETWSSFRREFPRMLEELAPAERFLLGKIHFVPAAPKDRLVAELAAELGFAGEYRQSFYNERTLAYALRVRGNESLLHGTFSPVRHLVESGSLAAGSFEASLLVVQANSVPGGAAELVEFLDLGADPLLLGQYAKGAAANHVPHLFLTEGFPKPRTLAFTLLQLLYLDGSRLQRAAAPPAPAKKKRKPRKRPARRAIGRMPTLPPIPPPESWS